MPLVRIALLEGKRPAYKREIGDAVHRALVSTLAVPERDRFRAIADNVAALGVRREDVWINLVEVAKENWSFGNGLASYAPEETLAA